MIERFLKIIAIVLKSEVKKPFFVKGVRTTPSENCQLSKVNFRNSLTQSPLASDHSRFTTLFCSQALHRVCHRSAYCLETYCHECYDQRAKSGNKKYCPGNVDPVRKIFQPFTHKIPCNGECDDNRNESESEEIF